MSSPPTPQVPDPFAGTAADPTVPHQNPDGSVTIPAAFPARDFVLNNLMDTLALEALANLLGAAEQTEQLRTELEASRKLVPTLETQLKQAQGSVQALCAAEAAARTELAEARNQLTELAKLAQGAKAPAEPVKPALDDQGKPLGEFTLVPTDPLYTEPSHIAEMRQIIKDQGMGTAVIACNGPAGVGKTYGIEQLAASEGWPFIAINCKGEVADDWIAYREVVPSPNGTGTVTTWKMGRLAQAVIDAGKHGCAILLDEIDMATEAFKYACLSLLDLNPAQRRLDTPACQIPVGQNIQWFLCMNGTGSNPASRHRGTIPEALRNRVWWVPAEMPSAADLRKLLTRRFPGVQLPVVQKVATTTLALMTAAGRNDLDADVSIRTAIKALSAWGYGEGRAWKHAILGGIEDIAMAEKAKAIISTGGRK